MVVNYLAQLSVSLWCCAVCGCRIPFSSRWCSSCGIGQKKTFYTNNDPNPKNSNVKTSSISASLLHSLDLCLATRIDRPYVCSTTLQLIHLIIPSVSLLFFQSHDQASRVPIQPPCPPLQLPATLHRLRILRRDAARRRLLLL